MRKRGAQKATPQMGRMGAEDPSSLPSGPLSGLHVVHERAIGGRAEDDFTLHRLGEWRLATAFDQGQDAAAETRAHDARAQEAFDPPGPLNQDVDVWGRHLEIVAQALMRLLEQNSQPLEAVFFERVDECMHTSNLRIDMTHALGVACLRFTAALVVWSLGEVAMLARVDDRDDELLGKWHRLIFKGRAVEQQGMASPSERRCELIHHADVDACGPLLGALARERRLDSAELGAEARGDGYEQRGR